MIIIGKGIECETKQCKTKPSKVIFSDDVTHLVLQLAKGHT